MNMVPGIGGAPMGMDPLEDVEVDDAPAIEIEIEDPESVKIGIDGMEIDLMPEDDGEVPFDANLAEHMNEGELQKIASDIVGLVEADKTLQTHAASGITETLQHRSVQRRYT